MSPLNLSSSAYKKYHEHPQRTLQHFVAFFIIAGFLTALAVANAEDLGALYDAQVVTLTNSSHVEPVTVQRLTTKLLQTVSAYENATPQEQPALLARAQAIAQTRKATLLKEIASITNAVPEEEYEALLAASSKSQGKGVQNSNATPVSVAAQAVAPVVTSQPTLDALPTNVGDQMPAEVKQYLESEVSLEGTVTVTHVDGLHDDSKYVFDLRDTAGNVTHLFFSKNVPALQSGQKIRIHGIKLDNVLAASGGGSVTVVAAAPSVLSGTFGNVKTLVILVNFQDNVTQPVTVATVQSTMNTVSSFDKENSFNQTALVGVKDTTQAADVAGWYTLPISTTCDYNTIATYAKQAATSGGYALSNYTRYVYAFPGNNSCGWAGMGTVGGNPAQAWINGMGSGVIAHEMGHNFGLYHAHSLNCNPYVYAASGCTTTEYGDEYDTMGMSGYSAHYNAFQKERLGWLNYNVSPPITTVTTSGTYTIAAYESLDTQPKALKVLQRVDPTNGNSYYYYIEARRKIGFDTTVLSLPGSAGNGVLLHLATPGDANSSDLLDYTPATSATVDAAINVGQTYTDSIAGVSFTVISADITGAKVQISFGTPVCTKLNPSITLSPSSQGSAANGTAVYQAVITNNDTASCSSSTFALTSALPSGWSGTYTPATMSLAAGASGTSSLLVAPSSATLSGSYSISGTVTNSATSSLAGSTNATYVIYSADTTPPSVAITSPANGSTVSGTSVSIAATASDNVGVAKVEFYIDGKLAGTSTAVPYTYKWQLRKVTSGSHVIAAKAYDAAGNNATAQIAVTK